MDLKKRKEYQTRYHREVWYPKNKARRLELNYANRTRVKDIVQKYKLEKGCIDCGYNKFAEALDFDHLKDKKFNISTAYRDNIGWDKVKEEISKCEVVCANCHRVRTASRRQLVFQ